MKVSNTSFCLVGLGMISVLLIFFCAFQVSLKDQITFLWGRGGLSQDCLPQWLSFQTVMSDDKTNLECSPSPRPGSLLPGFQWLGPGDFKLSLRNLFFKSLRCHLEKPESEVGFVNVTELSL